MLGAWAELQAEQARIESRRERLIAPHRQAFDEATAPINSKFDKQLSPVREQSAQLEAQINEAVKYHFERDRTSGFYANEAEAVVITTSVREIDARVFYNNTPEDERSSAFWSCLKVQIGKAEKFLGDAINRLAEQKTTYKVSIRVKK